MSVINQMLKDLEQRQATTNHGVDMFRLLKVGPDFDSRSSINYSMLFLIVLLAVVLLLVFNNWRSANSGFDMLPQKETASVDLPDPKFVAKPLQSAPELVYEDSAEMSSPHFDSQIAIENIGINESKGSFSIEVESQTALYESVKRKAISGNMTRYQIDNSFLKSALPSLKFNNQYVKSVEIYQSDDGIVIDVEPKKNMITLFNEIMPIDYDGYRLNIEVKPDQVQRSNEPIRSQVNLDETRGPEAWEKEGAYEEVSIKKASSSKVSSKSRYHRALGLLKSGNVDQAIVLLEEVLQASPGIVQARVTLSSLYLKLGRYMEAAIILDDGISLEPHNADLAMVYGRLLVDQGKFDKANNVLKTAEGNAVKNAEYMALVAAVSQRLSDHGSAVEYYVKALDLKSNKSVWWIGMGISLESLKKDKDALKAYQAAKNSGLHDPELIKYVDARIKHLNV